MFVLLANCNFVPGRYEEWQEAYDKLNSYVWENEPTTLTYYFGLPIQYWTHKSAATHMLAFECYGKREDLYETQFNSSVMAEFLTKIPPTMTTGLDLNHYEDAAGFLDKPGDKRECEIMRDVRINCKPEAREVVLQRLSTVAKTAMNDHSFDGTWTFLPLKSLDNDRGVRIFERFRDWNSLDKHNSSKAMLDFWLSSKEEIVSMESQVYVPNGKGWLHRRRPSKQNGL